MGVEIRAGEDRGTVKVGVKGLVMTASHSDKTRWERLMAYFCF